MDVLFSCRLCGLTNRPVSVRPRGDEPLANWLAEAKEAADDAHASQSPHCEGMVRLKVPVPVGVDRMGGDT